MFKKKAQGISITTIIIAAIALVVLVVLIAIFVGKMRGWVGEIEECDSKGGQCMEEAECKESNFKIFSGTDCEKRYDEGKADGPACCVSLGLNED